jgi:DNA-directed RNA polymerase sigma subunit (sigma70/sigma32)
MIYTNNYNSFQKLNITLEEYNLLNLTASQRLTLDLRFGLNQNSSMTFTDIAKIRNVSSVAVRSMFIRTCDKISQKQYIIKYKPIEDDLFKLSLALFIEKELPFLSHQTYKE